MATNQWTRVSEGMRRKKSSNVIYANFRFGGKTFRHSLDTEDKLVARNTLISLRQKLESGEFDPESHTTVKEIAPKFLESVTNMSESFQTRASGHIKFFIDEFGDKDPRRLRPMEIDEWLNDLREKREFGEDSYNKYVATFKDFYAFLIKNHFATINPLVGFSFLKAKAIRKYTPSAVQVSAIINHIRNKQYFPEKDETAPEPNSRKVVFTKRTNAGTFSEGWLILSKNATTSHWTTSFLVKPVFLISF